MPKFTVADIKTKTDAELYRLRPNLILGPFQDENITAVVFRDGLFSYEMFESSIASRQTFRECISNAIDNVRRAIKDADVDPGTIKVELKSVEGELPIISVSNGGHMPPFDIHPDYNIPSPQLLVNVFKSGTNYEESENRLGGQNGIGSKAANLFSQWFELTIIDATLDEDNKYFQRFEEFVGDEPIITTSKAKNSMFKIRYQPNNSIGTPNLNWLAWEIVSAAVTSVKKITLTLDDKLYEYNDLKLIDILKFYPKISAVSFKIVTEDDEEDEQTSEKSVQEEVPVKKSKKGKKAKKTKPKLGKKEEYKGPEQPTPILHWKDKLGNEVIIADVHAQFKFPKVQGWVNGLPCSQGIHINAAKTVFVNAFKKKIANSKEYGEKWENRPVPVKYIKDNVLVLVKVEVSNPRFGAGQIKDTFTSPKVDLTLFDPKDKNNEKGKEPETWGNWKKSGLMYFIKRYWSSASEEELSKTDGKKTKHVKSKNYRVKANLAGTNRSRECTLVGCEGDSAKKYEDKRRAMQKNASDTFGIFCFKGKLLNALNATPEELAKNVELMALKKVLGLQEGLDYGEDGNMNTLRYGKEFVIIADADDDGVHIKGLILLFFHTRYPSLIKRGFVTAFFSPVARVKWEGQLFRFYRFEAYLSWLREDKAREAAKVQYFKGLATSKNEDIKDDHIINKKVKFVIDKNSDDYMDLAFNDEYSDSRKEWLAENFGKSEDLDGSIQTLSEFVDDDLPIFFHRAIVRAIPAAEDGQKDSTRKLAWFLRNVKKSGKVSTLASKVGTESKYHHGPIPLEKTLIGMVQNFAGKNNVPLFMDDGQFGTRVDGLSGASRYVETRISPIYDKIFPKVDYPLLTQKFEEGKEIEPAFLLPIVPFQLVNGENGIGVGWSTFIPAYNLKTIISNIKRKLNGKNYLPMIPWYNNYDGIIEKTKEGFISKGILQKLPGNKWRVTELPLWIWKEAFVARMDDLIEKKIISDCKENDSADTDKIDYIITGPNADTFIKLAKEEAKKEGREYKEKEHLDADELFEKVFTLFGLKSTHSMQNMVLLVGGKPTKFDTVEDIMDNFIDFRMGYYEKRCKYLEETIKENILSLEYQIIIIGAIKDEITHPNHDDFIEKIIALDERLTEEIIEAIIDKNTISTIRRKAVEPMKEKLEGLKRELAIILENDPKKLWLKDLASLEKAL